MSGLISVDQALAHLSAHPLPVVHRTVPLSEALGRRLAEPVLARVTRPPAAVSAMDGYAVRLGDVRESGAKLRVIGEAPAGTPFEKAVGAGEAVRIFTGGELPNGADHIVIQEDTIRNGDVVTCKDSYAQAQFVRAAGLDFSEGETLIEAGTVIGAAELAIAAAANRATLNVVQRPRVGILANGDELRPPGSELKRGQIVNSNPAGLAPLIQAWGGEPIDLGVASDSVESIREHMHVGGEIDLYLPVGGASVGDHDYMRAAFAEEGFTPVFEKIAVKPGKPTWFSTREGQRVLGLPGNPASAFVCAHLFASALLGAAWTERQVMAQLSAPLKESGKREQFLRAMATLGEDGQLRVEAATNQDSSLLRPFLSCNALIRREIGAAGKSMGDTVPIIMIGPLQG
ncbi:molybdopterin molybdotransferase MoeA [Hyphomonas sp. FCG-A18]|uniref:molybdopterin molybdotransferase MoeA n=1 Tax=Hyphomonas sp. FCG-A18 TaxID=3080019 RepID=UPI002B30AB57|nr:molybdopterin molybdotransferase MoeA [Hyphomonas sp. FCG-A18]